MALELEGREQEAAALRQSVDDLEHQKGSPCWGEPFVANRRAGLDRIAAWETAVLVSRLCLGRFRRRNHPFRRGQRLMRQRLMRQRLMRQRLMRQRLMRQRPMRQRLMR
jgi:hypothetical protein